MAEGEIVLINGSYDESRGEPQIIAEGVSADFNNVAAAESHTEQMDTSPMAWDSNDEPPPPDDEWRGPLEDELPPPAAEEAAFSDPAAEVAEPPARPEGADESEPEWVNGDGHLTMPDEEKPLARPARHIAVVMQTGDDPDKDKRKLGRIHNTLIKYPGSDKFTIVIRRGDTETPLAFPDKTTQVCEALLADLSGIVGGEAFITVADADA